MSPWGKYYLENVEYRPGWWQPFHSWRMHYFGLREGSPIDVMRKQHGPRVERHLDAVERELHGLP